MYTGVTFKEKYETITTENGFKIPVIPALPALDASNKRIVWIALQTGDYNDRWLSNTINWGKEANNKFMTQSFQSTRACIETPRSDVFNTHRHM